MNNWITTTKVLSECSNLESLNDDLLELIFDRVPYKSLCAVKCVSPRLYKLICLAPQLNRKTIMMHLQPPKPLLLCMSPNERPIRISSINLEETLNDENHIVKLTPCLNHLSAFVKGQNVDILPCSIGELICLSSGFKFYVCNPSTGQVVPLPDPSPSSSPYPNAGTAFGYIPLTNEFKVARFYTKLDEVRCEIFTISNDKEIESCSWRGVEDICPFPVQHKGVMVNGIFYWLPDEFDSTGEFRRPDVLFLDVFTKKFGVKSIPAQVTCQHSSAVRQAELEGQYCLVDPYAEYGQLIIWSLKNENEEIWVKRYNICIPNILGGWLDSMLVYYVWDGEMVLRDVDHSGAIYCYNLESGVYRVLSSNLLEGMDLILYARGSFSLKTRNRA